MKRLIFAAVLAASLILTTSGVWSQQLPFAAAPAEQVGMSKERLARLGTALKKEVDTGQVAGVVVMVARKGKLVYSEAIGFQDKDAGKPMALDSIFRIYSMTKPLASVVAMMLVEEGTIQLADPVSTYLPAFKNQRVSVAKVDAEFARVTYTSVPAEREMTVHDLLRHTSGLAYGEITVNAQVKDAYAKAGLYTPATIDFDVRGLTPAEEIERLAAAPLAHQPGTVWEYSLATDVLGRVVEAVAGKRLGALLAEKIFEPLHMSDSGFFVPPEKMGRLAQPLANDPRKLIDVSQPPANDSAGAGGVSTAADYLRFLQMLANGGQLDGVRLLSRPTVALMASDHLGTQIAAPNAPSQNSLGTPGYTFGLGFMVRQGPGITGVPGSPGAYGWGGYAGTYFLIDPKQELVVLMLSQSTNPARNRNRRLLTQLVYQAIAD
jgi:CubicO group peptidase (beta-lactamase class C family)